MPLDDIEVLKQRVVNTTSARHDHKLLAALDVRFDSDAGYDLTVREYLYHLLARLWLQREAFNARRPFGMSGWEYDLYRPLARAGFIDMGPPDDDGEITRSTTEQEQRAHTFVAALIEKIFRSGN